MLPWLNLWDALATMCMCVCGICDDSLGVSADLHMRSWWLGLFSGGEQLTWGVLGTPYGALVVGAILEECGEEIPIMGAFSGPLRRIRTRRCSPRHVREWGNYDLWDYVKCTGHLSFMRKAPDCWGWNINQCRGRFSAGGRSTGLAIP